MRALVCAALAALATPSLAHADYEGVLQSKVTGRHFAGKARTFVSSEGLRHEMEMEVPQEQQARMGKTMKSIVIVKASEPDTTYFLDENRKTYSTIARDRDEHGDEEKWTAKRTGKDVVAGFACDVVVLTRGSGKESEVCVAPELVASAAWLRALQSREEQGGLWKALQGAGVKGFPVRWRSLREDEPYAMEVVSAERRRVPASTFAIPAGYQKSAMLSPMSSPESSKRLDEAMKKMSPEDRQRMEEMMKNLGKKKGE